MRVELARRATVLLFATLLFFCARSQAQSTNATVTGQITDQSGKVVGGAAVVFTNINTGVPYTTQTNAEGIYSLPTLQPGIYRANVTKDGFKSIVKPDIDLHVQDQVSINFALQVGSVSETITVESGAPTINTTDGSVSTVIDHTFVDSLPLNGRSFNTLMQLTPGVVIAPASYSSPGQFSIAGQRTDANNFTVDGVSANFGVTAGQGASASGTGGVQAFSALGSTSSLVSVEALQEFRIETSSFAPEFGKSPGGQVILTTRSGTNSFHGGVYEYFRNTVMDANDWFAKSAGNPRAPEQHNDFGGFLGGPISKDKTFFFFSYEGARLRLPATSVIEVPSEGARSAASAAVAPFLNAFPMPNGPVSAQGDTAQFTGTYSNAATLNATSIRIDRILSDRFSIFGRYNHAPSETANRLYSLSDLETTKANTDTLTLGLNMALNHNVFNALRGNYSAQSVPFSDSLDSFGGAVPLDPSQLLGSLSPSSNFAGFLAFDATDYFIGPNSKNRTRQMNFTDDLDFTVGSHQIKVGADYRAIFFDSQRADHNVYAIAFSVQSLVNTGQADFLAADTFLPARLLSQSTSIYGQDVWKTTQRLTLTYGVRWELSPAPSALGATKLASWTNVDNPAQLALSPAGTPLWNTTYGNFAPRFGFAYVLGPGGNLILRGGAGIFYDLGAGSAATAANYFPNIAFGGGQSVPLPITDVTPYLPVISLEPPFPSGIYAFAPNLKLPRSYQWNLAVEKSLGARQSLSATYVGQAGRDLLRQEALYQPNPNFSGDFLVTQNTARSNYDALQIQYRAAFAGRFQALMNYTFSHSLDNISNDTVAGLSNSVISGLSDYASSDFDVRHSFSGAVIFAVPQVSNAGLLAVLTKDWSLSVVTVARTGFPYNASILYSSPDPGGYATSRPDLVPGEPFYLQGSQCSSEFVSLGVLVQGQSCPGGIGLNPAAFSIPSTVRQGTERRNDIPGLGLTQLDFSIGRKFSLTERLNLQLRADAFNLFNHPNFTNPLAEIDGGSATLISQEMLNHGLGGLNPLFQEGGPRSFQLSLKLTF
jgi:hypothetical protein